MALVVLVNLKSVILSLQLLTAIIKYLCDEWFQIVATSVCENAQQHISFHRDKLCSLSF